MAVTVTHATVAVGTDAGNGEIRKAQWNENHTVTNAADVTAANDFSGGNQTVSGSGNLLVTGSGGNGYGTGSGGTVTQSTSKSTGVTLNKSNGTITLNAAALAASTTVSFTVTNSVMASTDHVLLTIVGGGTMTAYNYWVQSGASGSFVVYVRNISGGSLSEGFTLAFCIIKGAVA